MKILGNIIWFIFGGVEIAIEYFLAGVVLLITIIGIPFGLQCFKLGVLALWPFGSEVKKQSGKTGCISTGMNILWFFLFESFFDLTFWTRNRELITFCQLLAEFVS